MKTLIAPILLITVGLGWLLTTWNLLPGVNWINSEDRFRLRRLPIERYTTRADFKGMLALPELLS